jgi:hypothetical protein
MLTKGAVKIKHAEVEFNLVKLQIIFWELSAKEELLSKKRITTGPSKICSIY